MKQLLDSNNLILIEAAIVERIRRSHDVELHPKLVNAPLIYDDRGKKALQCIYQEYVDIAIKSHIPILLCTPTWRANYSRVISSDVPLSINTDSVNFLKQFKSSINRAFNKVFIGGMIGCKNDCYKPDEGLSEVESKNFHSWQIEQLVNGGVDFMIAETLPNITEALGIAKAMELFGVPYIISFVISRDGRVLDGTPLFEAVDYIDKNTNISPVGYMVNCVYPSFICPENQPKELFERLIGCQANASSLDHCDLDSAKELEVDSISEWGKHMIELNFKYGVKILGGCCGTTGDHLQYIVNQ